MSEYKYLSISDVDHFLENGYVVVKGAFTREKAGEFTETLWQRLGMDPNDKLTWAKERIHMPVHRREKVETFAPQAWAAIQDLLGGAERIDEEASTWGDSFIVNLGTQDLENVKAVPHPRELDNWHVDGDFFVHYLDSPEQALLVIPIFSDILHGGGATMISLDGLDLVARYLAEHPEGVIPEELTLIPSTNTMDNPSDNPGFWSHLEKVKQCEKFVELTGDVGDVVLMHPLMLHSASKNYLRIPRVITNPPVRLKEPFKFRRQNSSEFSLVERKTLLALGVDQFDFQPVTERRNIVPARVLIQQRMLEEERRRLVEREPPSA